MGQFFNIISKQMNIHILYLYQSPGVHISQRRTRAISLEIMEKDKDALHNGPF